GRTFEGVPTFPSGHTAAVTALSVVAGLLMVSVAHARPAVAVWTAAAVVLLAGAAIGSAVVAVNWHYPTDALGGFCTAVALVVALAFLLDGLRSSLSRGWIQQMTIVASVAMLIISLVVLAIDRTRSMTTVDSSSLVMIPSTRPAYPLPVTVPVIGSTSGLVTATISVGTSPGAMAVTPDGRHTYVTNQNSDNVTVIESSSTR
ncbi:MAG: phosphatase PAP2 family protein, partial [Mycobacteriales bacterium]